MTTNNSNFIPEIWSKKLSKLLDNNGVMMQCVNKDYEGEIKSAGDTVQIRSYGDVSVHTYTGVISQYDDLVSSKQTMLIDQQKDFAFKVPDIDKAQSDIELMNGYLERAKIAVDLVKDSFLLGKYSDVPAANITYAVGAPFALTKDNIYTFMVGLATALKNSNAIQTGGKKPWVVLNPTLEALLIQSPEFIQATDKGDRVLREGSVGMVAGLDVLVSTNFVAIDGKYPIMAGTNDAITFASQVIEVEKLRDQSSFADLIRGLYVYGAKTVVPKALALGWVTVA